MPLISKEEVRSRLQQEATNSSHFVWLLADLQFFEARNHWIFAFTKVGTVTLIALEPLVPGAPTRFDRHHRDQFREAWEEFVQATTVGISVFLGIYGPFVEVLRDSKFTTLKVGKEPWVDLHDCIPTGNSGKGVRAARNQALRAGLTVEEWKSQEIHSDPEKRKTLKLILGQWKGVRLLDVGGFLNAVDPFAYSDDRRYFVVRSAQRVEAFLVATPISGIKSYFLEDMILRNDAPNGCGELLTLEAMVALGQSGSQRASLGVVSLNDLGSDSRDSLPSGLKRGFKLISRLLRTVYNTDGMEIYRRRFKPHNWTEIYLAVNSNQAKTWLKVVWAILVAFRPRLQPSLHWLRGFLTRPLRKYPITIGVALISVFCFGAINHFGDLPEAALAKYGFFGDAPALEWPFRSVISDFLYFNLSHFVLWGGMFLFTLAWAERKHSFRFLMGFLLVSTVFDDIVNYWFIIKPFDYFQPHIFQKLVGFKDVGSSLLLTAFLGLQVRQFRVFREPVFAIIGLGLILLFLFPASRLVHFVLNLNHFLFFTTGYLVGTLRFEMERVRSRKAARLPPPIASSVLIPTKKTSRRPITEVASAEQRQKTG